MTIREIFEKKLGDALGRPVKVKWETFRRSHHYDGCSCVDIDDPWTKYSGCLKMYDRVLLSHPIATYIKYGIADYEAEMCVEYPQMVFLETKEKVK